MIRQKNLWLIMLLITVVQSPCSSQSRFNPNTLLDSLMLHLEKLENVEKVIKEFNQGDLTRMDTEVHQNLQSSIQEITDSLQVKLMEQVLIKGLSYAKEKQDNNILELLKQYVDYSSGRISELDSGLVQTLQNTQFIMTSNDDKKTDSALEREHGNPIQPMKKEESNWTGLLNALLVFLGMLIAILILWLNKLLGLIKTKTNTNKFDEIFKKLDTIVENTADHKLILQQLPTLSTESQEISSFRIEKKPEPTKDPNTLSHVPNSGYLPKETQTTWYASRVDIKQPAGFTVENLSTRATNNLIYQILSIDEAHASYHIREDDSTAQRKAISNYNYILADGCEYESLPRGHQRIENISHGKLKKTGGVWKITKKAVIKFTN